jgi:23S rRNA (cytidine1920-2'-O)/16S rRNA (cytidine1409-2'-O)-methyltransferase
LSQKRRLDELLVQRGLARDVGHARALILAGRVRGVSHATAGQNVPADQTLFVEDTPPFVSRGGLKLRAALDSFRISVAGRACVDIGASTGGFTDCLLQSGAATVLAVDVGHGQLDWKLRNDCRVMNREKTHVFTLTRDDMVTYLSRGLPGAGAAGLVTVDVSFISLKKVMPHLADIFPGGTEFVILVKPQFEVNPKDAPQGVVRDPEVHRRVVNETVALAVSGGFRVLGQRESPVTGPEGNREFLIHLRRV